MNTPLHEALEEMNVNPEPAIPAEAKAKTIGELQSRLMELRLVFVREIEARFAKANREKLEKLGLEIVPANLTEAIEHTQGPGKSYRVLLRLNNLPFERPPLGGLGTDMLTESDLAWLDDKIEETNALFGFELDQSDSWTDHDFAVSVPYDSPWLNPEAVEETREKVKKTV